MEDRVESGTVTGTDGAPGAFETDDGRLVLFLEVNPDAYIRSDVTVDVER